MADDAKSVLSKALGSWRAAEMALAALDVAGFVVVPRKATEAMRRAGRTSYDSRGIWDLMVEEALRP